jgi:hypothetical protein
MGNEFGYLGRSGSSGVARTSVFEVRGSYLVWLGTRCSMLVVCPVSAVLFFPTASSSLPCGCSRSAANYPTHISAAWRWPSIARRRTGRRLRFPDGSGEHAFGDPNPNLTVARTSAFKVRGSPLAVRTRWAKKRKRAADLKGGGLRYQLTQCID